MAGVTAQSILDEIKPLGAEGYRNILLKHGIKEPIYGVKVEYLKKIQKRIKKDYQLALDLYDTGVYDAMYLAGLIADDLKMTRKDLQRWVEKANSPAVCGSVVAWVAAESNHGREAALDWIDSKKEEIAASGWGTLAGIVSIKEDSELDLKELKQLLGRVAKTIHKQTDDVKLAMNRFVIAVGTYVKGLTAEALASAKAIGEVSADMGETACKIPDAAGYINKAKERGVIGKKRKTVKC